MLCGNGRGFLQEDSSLVRIVGDIENRPKTDIGDSPKTGQEAHYGVVLTV